MMRCAIYARFSSDRQKPCSIDDQVRQCRKYAAAQGWRIAEAHMYADRAVSGTSQAGRDGFHALAEAALGQPAPFDCILVDDTSRIGRDQADALQFYKRLSFAGIRLVAISQGVDSASEQADLVLGIHGIIDATYSKELAKKTHRGMEGALLRGRPCGGRCFGYRTARGGENGEELATVVHEGEAAVVRRIFRESAAGRGFRPIARDLNREGVASPQPYRGQRHASWAATAVRQILLNERYTGALVWNKTRKVRHPETGRKIQRPRPANEWQRMERPELRIVEQEVFERAQRGIAKRAAARHGELGGRRANHLLSGLLECAECGSKLVIVAGGRRGDGKKSYAKYGCPLARRGVCGMTMTIYRESLERKFLAALRQALEDAGAQVRIREGMRRLAERAAEERMDAGKRLAELKGRIERLAALIADGNHSAALLEKLRQMEGEHDRLAAEKRAPAAAAKATPFDALGMALQATVANPAAIKQELSGRLRIVASGKAEGLDCTLSCGAGGRNRTAHASLFRAALYH